MNSFKVIASEAKQSRRRHALWLCVDHCGILLVSNFLAFLLCAGVVTAPLGLAGMISLCHRLVTTGQASTGDFWRGMRSLGLRVYAWSSAVTMLALCCFVSFRFYAKLPLFFAAMGLTVVFCVAAATVVMGFLTLPHAAKKIPWKESVRESLRLFLQQPRQLLRVLLDVLLMECLLILTGVGFLAFGLAWPLLASLLAQTEPPHAEERTLLDFFLPQNLLK